MRLPAIQGIIERRILANYRVRPERMAAVLPAPFRPQLVDGWAIGGICLIRLARVRPRRWPLPWGLRSENAAHRIAVEWDEAGETRQGVYIPRRDTDSRLNAWLGGRAFPGVHHHARFDVEESDETFAVRMTSRDGGANVFVRGRLAESLPDSSVFGSIEEASRFFEAGSLGYSETRRPGTFDGLELRCFDWGVRALAVEAVESSFFADIERFPAGSVEFDGALLMRGIRHEWHGRADICCPPA